MAKRTSRQKPTLRFDRKLILNRWMFRQFEVDEFKSLGERIDSQDHEGFDNENRTQRYTVKDLEFDLVYVNGDNNLENLKREDETWKVRLIEEDFQRLMFDGEDV